MGCSSSLIMGPVAWKPCGAELDDELESASAPERVALAAPCGNPTKSKFNLAQVHPSQPPFLGSSYSLPKEDWTFPTTPPPLLARSPSDTASLVTLSTCSTSDKTLVMSNLRSRSDNTSIGSLTPRRLFDSPSASTKSHDDQFSLPSTFERDETSAVIHQGVLVKGAVESPSHRAWSRKQRHINTLPSTEEGQPIRLRVVESYGGETSAMEDCSYDPYFSSGQYRITTSNGFPYGNDLSVQMGPQHMTLQEGDGRVLAVMRSRHTSEPSHVVYAPKPRYPGQSASDAVDDDSWYPWALVKKDGPSVTHDVSVHLNTLHGWGSIPVWKCRHGFVGNTQTHTVVTRVVSEIEEIPCCFVLRDPINLDVFNITIAPGIDPLLSICYLAVHQKMDVEPLMSSAIS